MSRVCVSTDHVVDGTTLYRRPHAAHLGADQAVGYVFLGTIPEPTVFVDTGGVQNTWYEGDISFPVPPLSPAGYRQQIKVDRSGWYRVGTTMGWAVAAASTVPYTYLRCLISQNSTPIASDTVQRSNATNLAHSASAIVLARAGDFFMAEVQADATNTSMVNFNFSQPIFTVVWRGGTRLL